ncbi:MAG: methyltransferase [Bacteroidales bacterium]|nr:MAG: methyltransferase [Bacteroidales bacterium]
MNIEDYILQHTEKEPQYLKELSRRTSVRMINPRMQSGHYQGRILKMLAKLIQPQNILEIGTFSGYATLSLAESLGIDGHIDTIEIDDELEEFILDNFAKSPYANKITLHIGDALQIVPTLNKMYDMIFIDGNKRYYMEYLQLTLESLSDKGLIVADNTLWSGKVMEPPAKNDHQTKAIIEFNDHIAQRDDIEQIIMPIRDGLTLIRKKL